MKIEGVCDFCGDMGDWEGGLYYNKHQAKSRPDDWCAMFPWNRLMLPANCTFDPTSLKEHSITTRFACPKCYRSRELENKVH